MPFGGNATSIGIPSPLPVFADPRRILVHTELGIPIHFEPRTSQFYANINARTGGRGSSAEFHSDSFETVIERIRSRALVTPVDAYTLEVETYRGNGTAEVTVTPCQVVEYHKGRQEPFVIVQTRPVKEGRYGNEKEVIRRFFRTKDAVYLPSEEQIEAVRAAAQNLVDIEQRTIVELHDARTKLQAATEAVTRIKEADLKFTQQTGQQRAIDAETIGAAVYTLDEEEAEDALQE